MHSGDAASFRRCWDEQPGRAPARAKNCKALLRVTFPGVSRTNAGPRHVTSIASNWFEEFRLPKDLCA